MIEICHLATGGMCPHASEINEIRAELREIVITLARMEGAVAERTRITKTVEVLIAATGVVISVFIGWVSFVLHRSP